MFGGGLETGATEKFTHKLSGVKKPQTFEAADIINFTDTTLGHRFMAPDAIEVTGFDDYRKKLEKAMVVLDQKERRQRIKDAAEKLAKEENLSLRADDGLLNEVAGLVEYPEVLMGRIDPHFMELPSEVLTVSMKTHQKYFSLEDAEGELASRFITVANISAPVGTEVRDNIVAGNERVLRARLADAEFFWQQDRKQSLDSRVPELQDVVFHAKLGSMHHKVDRIEALAMLIAGLLDHSDRDQVRSAARLAKADLVSEMVGEFPELQGIIGGHYAAAEGEPEAVCRAIAEHYAPLGPNDRCPSEPVSVAVALADKIDSLAGFFSIGEKPTGSKDPYALRRAALGIIRMIVENRLRLPLAEALEEAYRMQPTEAQHGMMSRLAAAGTAGDTHSAGNSVKLGEHALAEEVLNFLADRLKVVLRDEGVRHDLISAVFAVEKPDGGREDDFVRLLARVRALGEFLDTEDGNNLLTAYRRAANIVRIEEKKDDKSYGSEVAEEKLSEAQEKALFNALAEAESEASEALQEEDFTRAMGALAALREPVDEFFDNVTVNVEDAGLRRNRLRLLRHIERTLSRVADFSKIEG
ncbi:MAG: glycine--tRNA ligase subunit beta [Rhodovibrionaceae bacterium]|nr:glycine--tRNA ligase subunit beta [Rhodovibrionaceae bacterium]